MSRTARLWKGVGPLTLGGILLSGGIAARAADSASLSEQLADLGRQAAAQGKADDARTFYKNALKLDPNNAEAQKPASASSRTSAGSRSRTRSRPRPRPATRSRPRRSPARHRPSPRRSSGRPRSPTSSARRSSPTSASGCRPPATMTNARNPEAALATLRDALTVVQSADNVPEDTRRRLENEVRNAIAATERLEERINLEKAEQYRIVAAQAARTSAVERLVRDQETTAHPDGRVRQPDGRGRPTASSPAAASADIDVTRQPFVDARFRAQAARALNPQDLAPWAGMFVSDTVGFYSQSIQYDRLKEYRAMLTWADVDRTSSPSPTTRAIEYPERAAWQALSERRIARYGDADYLFDRDEKTKAILKKLDEPISMNFPNDTPLEDVKKYIEHVHPGRGRRPADRDPDLRRPQGLQDADKTMADTVTINLEGIPLKTTLRLLLKQLSLTYTVKDGLMTITSTASDDQPTEIRVYHAADLALIPLSLMGGGGGGMGGMGGGMGGMGGGMGGMGGGMGGMGGGMGGMGGGMGGMGGMMSVPPQDPGTRRLVHVRGKKKQLNAINQIPPNTNSGHKQPGPSRSTGDRPWCCFEAGPEAIKGRRPDDQVRPARRPRRPPPRPAGPKAAARRQAGGGPVQVLERLFRRRPSSRPRPRQNLFQTVAELIKAKKFDHAEAAIKGYLNYHGKDAQPWMYELLVKCIEAGARGTEKRGSIRQTLGFAAYLAKRTKNPNDLVRVADMLVLRELLRRRSATPATRRTSASWSTSPPRRCRPTPSRP